MKNSKVIRVTGAIKSQNVVLNWLKQALKYIELKKFYKIKLCLQK